MSSQWGRVKELFAECADLHGEQLEARLAGAPDEIRVEVESLLAAEQQAGPFLGGQTHVTRLGAYELIAKIGEGGMGAVWEARRADGQFEHRAAIKIIREHCDSAANLERFRAERQLLARLDHPNISRLLDGGTTPGGLPYLVMELIAGSRIDVYCRQRTVEQKLRLILAVCGAVDYANRHGVLHRDLKPANILVTRDGIPKLIDFGIAKATGDERVTATLERIATPEYTSPEHYAGKPLTAASEVHALGVTLYELLTGVKPYSLTGRSLPELTRMICETAPPKPSSLSGALSTDIDNILARAMHKDPRRRYPSAAEMAKDIEQHLKGGPVLARGDSIPYRLGRLLSANRKIAGAAATAFVLGASAWASWSYLHVRRFTHSSMAVIEIRGELKDPALDWLGRGVTETLTASLQHSGAFQVISADRVHAGARGHTAEQTAKSLGTQLYVDGVLTGAEANLRLDLQVHETDTGRTVFVGSFDAPSREAVFLLADQAATQIAGRLAAAPTAPIISKRLLTQSSDALRSYEEARQEMGKWHMGAAIEGFRKAIEIDPEFTMAYVGVAEVAGLSDRTTARGAIVRASDLASSRSLPRFSANLIQGLRLYFDGRLDGAVGVLRALAVEFPHEPEPVFWEGMAQGWGLRYAEAHAAFEQVTRLDPDNVFAWLLLAEMSGLHGAHDTARNAAARYCRLIGETEWNCYGLRGDLAVYAQRWEDALDQYRKMPKENAMAEASVLWLRGDSVEASRLLANSRALPANVAFVAANAAVARGDLKGAVDLYEKSARLSRNPAFQYQQLFKAAEIWLELGKPEKVLSIADRYDGPWVPGLSATAYLVLGNQNAAEAEFTAMRTALTPRIGEYLASRTEDFHRLLAAFYRGEHEAVAAAAARLPRRFWSLSSIPTSRSMLELGRWTEAREQLEIAWLCRLTFSGPELFEEHSGLHVILAEFYQGKLADMQGRPLDARRWLETFLRRFPVGREPLPQIQEARRILARL